MDIRGDERPGGAGRWGREGRAREGRGSREADPGFGRCSLGEMAWGIGLSGVSGAPSYMSTDAPLDSGP